MENQIIDIRACLDQLGASWQFGGSVTEGTEACWNDVRWEDARDKPTWESLVGQHVAVVERQTRELFKQERAKAVAAIVVEVDGLLFDGDEVAQGRMSRAALVMQDSETTTWVQANNIPAEVTKAQFIEAIRLSGAEQTRLWVFQG